MIDPRATCRFCSRPVDRPSGAVYYPEPRGIDAVSVIHTDCGRAEMAARRAILEPEGFIYRATWAPGCRS